MNDLAEIQKIYAEARRFMQDMGNGTQWKNTYPTDEILICDIQSGKHYVCTEKNEILGAFYFAKEIDETYLNIYNGKWINNNEYAVAHRIASKQGKKGVASFCLNWCFCQHPNIKIDTHENNIPMQKLLLKLGYNKCGVIRLVNNEERIAFQKY